MRVPPRALAGLLCLAMTVSACADGSSDPGGEDDTAADPPVTGAEDTADAAVGTAETELGEVLVDADGMTLYVFDPDEQGSSTCYDDCARDWPPLLAEEPVAAEGADDGLVGTTTRDDDTDQVTYGDWPLYQWSGDTERGDVAGHGVGGVWWTIDAEGEPQRDDTDEAPSY